MKFSCNPLWDIIHCPLAILISCPQHGDFEHLLFVCWFLLSHLNLVQGLWFSMAPISSGNFSAVCRLIGAPLVPSSVWLSPLAGRFMCTKSFPCLSPPPHPEFLEGKDDGLVSFVYPAPKSSAPPATVTHQYMLDKWIVDYSTIQGNKGVKG